MAKDLSIPAGLPRSFRGQDQIDGTKTTMLGPGSATKKLQPRDPAPNGADRTGLENAMGDLADQMHGGRSK